MAEKYIPSKYVSDGLRTEDEMAQVIASAIYQKKLSQQKLAEIIGVADRRTISLAQSPKHIVNLSFFTMIKLAYALDISLDKMCYKEK